MAKDIKYEKTRGDIPSNGKKRTIGKKRVPTTRKEKQKGELKEHGIPHPSAKN